MMATFPIAPFAPTVGRTALDFLGDVGRAGVRYAVLEDWRWLPARVQGERSRNGDGTPVPCLDVLVAPEDLDRLDVVGRGWGLVAVDGGSGAIRTYEPETGKRWRLRVRSRLRYGKAHPWLETGAAETHVLRRAVDLGGVRLLAASDRLVHLLLHCLIDLGALPVSHRQELVELMEQLRSDPPAAGRAAERVQQELAPALEWSTLLADVVHGRWDDLLARRSGIRRHLWRRSPIASSVRWLRGRAGGPAAARADGEEPRGRQDGAGPGSATGGGAGPGREQIRGSGLLLGGRGLSTGLKFLAELMIVRYLATGDYGMWTYALAAVVFLRGFATLGLNRAVVRFLPIHLERGEKDRFFSVAMLVLGGLLVASAAVITLFYAFPGVVAGLAGAEPGQPIDLLFIVIFLVPIEAVDDFLTGLCAAFTDSRTIFVRRYLLSPGLRIGVALTLVLLQADVRMLAYGYLLSGLFGIGYYAVSVYREIRKRGLIDDSISGTLVLPVRRVLSYTVPVMAADWCGTLMSTSGPLLLGYFSGMSTVALFQVVVPLVTLTKVVQQSFGVLFEPEASRLHARDDRVALDLFYWRSAVWVAVLTFPMFAVAFAAAEPLTVLLYGERYAEAAPILSILALGMFADSTLGFNAPTLRVVGKVRWLLVVNITAAAVNVGLNVLLIPRWGALGAAIGTGLSWAFHGLLKQAALRYAADVRAFGSEYLGPYVAIALTTVGLVLVRFYRPDRLELVLPAAAVAIALVWLTARSHLSISSTFPELARVPFLKAVLG